MQKINTEVLVIGGGATGTGVLRDLAMRGFKALLVERRDFTHGTTGRFHGLLHSGARYAVKDPEAARECNEENQILRKIMPHCIEDTSGYFILAPGDDPNYTDRFLAGCQQAKIPVEELDIQKMLAQEPHLNPKINRCFQVPDAAVDGFAAAHANIHSAQEYGAQALTYHEVIHLLTVDGGNTPNGRVVGALCHNLVNNENIEIFADLVINATGAWAGKIGATANIEIAISPGKGTMIAVSHRVVNTVINRLKMPSDGDILVPAHTVAVMGTTDEQVPDPDQFSIEPWEVKLMLSEGEKMIPGFSQLRMLRAWAGVRPLFQETKTDQSRDITRSFVLLDHEERDGVAGLLTITSGKWTTYRKMAEATVDKVCEKLGTERACRTHLEVLPTERGEKGVQKYHHLGERLSEVERKKSYGQLICECELATRKDIEQSILQGQAKTLDDIRRDVRLGMGPCQGGFCTLRAAGILQYLQTQEKHKSTTQSFSKVTDINMSLKDFLQERWKGLLPILWGQQLRQENLNELIYLNVLNVDHLPGGGHSRLSPDNYRSPTSRHNEGDSPQVPRVQKPNRASTLPHVDILIVGGGLAGLTAAWKLSSQGKKVRLITKGWGATHWASGCIDILGYYPVSGSTPIDAPVSAIARLTMEQPHHPYAHVNLNKISAVLREFQELCEAANYPLQGSFEQNWLLPTAAGALRPTCLAPETFIGGDLSDPTPMLVVGIEGFHDFYPHFAAQNLRQQGFSTKAVSISLPGLSTRNRIDSMVLARYFDGPDTVVELAEAIRPHLKGNERIGLPAVLGLRDSLGFVKALEKQSHCQVFEIPGIPPSIPGMRLHQIFLNVIQKNGGEIFQGLEAISSQIDQTGNKIEAIFTEGAARATRHSADHFILATGGILGGGIHTDFNGAVFDPIFNLALKFPDGAPNWLNREFLHPSGHPIFGAGVHTNQQFMTEFNNVFVIGGALAGDFVRERSLEGVAITSAFQVAEVLA